MPSFPSFPFTPLFLLVFLFFSREVNGLGILPAREVGGHRLEGNRKNEIKGNNEIGREMSIFCKKSLLSDGFGVGTGIDKKYGRYTETSSFASPSNFLFVSPASGNGNVYTASRTNYRIAHTAITRTTTATASATAAFKSFRSGKGGSNYYSKNRDLITLMSSMSFPGFPTKNLDMIGSFVKWRSPTGDPDPAEVDVLIETPSTGVRRISASIIIERPIEDVWRILSDYDNLSTYVPNLVQSKLVPNEFGQVEVDNGKCRLYQEGAQTIAGFKFGASLTMDMQEVLERQDSSLGGRKIKFTLVESAMFNDFSGEWRLQFYSRKKKPGTNEWQYFTKLFYMVTIRPRGPVPVVALEWRIREDIPVNLRAVKKSSESLNKSTLNELAFSEQDEKDLNELNQVTEKKISSITDSWEADETLEAYIDKLNQNQNSK